MNWGGTMNSPVFLSSLAPFLSQFVQYKRALNRKYRADAEVLRLFDRYLPLLLSCFYLALVRCHGQTGHRSRRLGEEGAFGNPIESGEQSQAFIKHRAHDMAMTSVAVELQGHVLAVQGAGRLEKDQGDIC
jgi:hypothetical protein